MYLKLQYILQGIDGICMIFGGELPYVTLPYSVYCMVILCCFVDKSKTLFEPAGAGIQWRHIAKRG